MTLNPGSMRSYRAALVLSLLMVGAACTAPSQSEDSAPIDANLVFLTREGCVNTDIMRANLDEALHAMGQSVAYAVVDLDALDNADLRRGYPTPTLLYKNRDVSGLPQPQPPLPEPT